MPEGPKGEKRPADVIGNAVKVMRIATEKLSAIDRSEISSVVGSVFELDFEIRRARDFAFSGF